MKAKTIKELIECVFIVLGTILCFGGFGIIVEGEFTRGVGFIALGLLLLLPTAKVK